MRVFGVGIQFFFHKNNWEMHVGTIHTYHKGEGGPEKQHRRQILLMHFEHFPVIRKIILFCVICGLL